MARSRRNTAAFRRFLFGRGFSPNSHEKLKIDSAPIFVMKDWDWQVEDEHWLFAFDSDDQLRGISRDIMMIAARCGLNYSQAIDEVWK